MKAAVINQYGPPEVFQVLEINNPVITNREVLIKVFAASVNPVDWKQRQGWHRWFLKANFPVVLGYDVAGEIVECGSQVTEFSVGDKVFCRLTRRFGGAFAEYAAASAGTLAKKHDALSWEEAAAIPLAGLTALQGLREIAHLQPGESVLVTGAAGGVGHFALQVARKMGGKVTAVCSGRHKQMMEELKPDQYLDYTIVNFKERQEKYDIVFDAAGVESYLTCKHVLNPKGRFITTLPRPKLLIHKILALFSRGKKVKTFVMKSSGNDLDEFSEMVKKGEIRIFIDSIFPLDKIADAHRRAEEYQTEGKIVVKVMGE